MQIPLIAMLMCSDGVALDTIERTFEEYGIPAYFCPSGKAAHASLNRRKFDLMVLDFDDPGAYELVDFHVMDARGIPSVIIALARNPALLKTVLSRRVHFAIQKPLAPELMTRTLKAAYSMIVAEKRISFRHSVRINANASILERNLRKSVGRTIVHDISHTGLGLQIIESVPRDTTIFVNFELPEEGGSIHAIGKVIWSNDEGYVGVQFRFMAPLGLRSLRSWLATHCPWDGELEPRLLDTTSRLGVTAASETLR